MTPKPTTPIDEAKIIVEKSGNGFHSRVVNKLRELNWKVLVSPYYSDNFTDKPREIDIVSQRDFSINSFMRGAVGNLKVTLFIECKYITGKTVFWFDKKDKQRSVERIMTDTGLEHPTRNISIKEHHYFNGDLVAKLFSSEKKAGSDSDIISIAINQNLNAMVYYRNRTDIIPAEEGRRDHTLNQASYPIIVVNNFDNFFKIDMDDATETITPIIEPFQLEVNYAYIDKDKNSHNEYFLIDIVSLDKLPDFLSMLETKDVRIISYDTGEKEDGRQRNNNNGGGIYNTTYK